MVKSIIFSLLVFFCCCLGETMGQVTIDWDLLSDVTFEEVYDDERGITYDEATFGAGIIPLDGQEVTIIGYLIPLDTYGIGYALSRNPNANCFFCGGAGPETVLQLALKPSAIKRYRTDDRKYFKGTLQINRSNADSFTYILRNAEPVAN